MLRIKSSVSNLIRVSKNMSKLKIESLISTTIRTFVGIQAKALTNAYNAEILTPAKLDPVR